MWVKFASTRCQIFLTADYVMDTNSVTITLISQSTNGICCIIHQAKSIKVQHSIESRTSAAFCHKPLLCSKLSTWVTNRDRIWNVSFIMYTRPRSCQFNFQCSLH